MNKYILVFTDGYEITYSKYDNYSDAKTAMDTVYKNCIPDDWFEECKGISALDNYDSILYSNHEDVYIWKIIKV